MQEKKPTPMPDTMMGDISDFVQYRTSVDTSKSQPGATTATTATIGPSFDKIEIGDVLPELRLPPLNRTTLALFGGASGDHNPIHLDIDFARRSGMPDVFAQGMLGMAWLGRLLTGWAPQSRLRSFDVRFLGITHLGHVITCSGTVIKKEVVDAERRVTVEIRTVNQYGESRITGNASVVLP